ncbi:exopolygalacturonase-like [Humulus lupulus]|uniref:exopolygalacturonase-like n=1 Tax=Humulus lupulus TaxID=3486 RepID=UPI002B406D06|nr:exopolygalacturonase-like [Humulus lupulus]
MARLGWSWGQKEQLGVDVVSHGWLAGTVAGGWQAGCRRQTACWARLSWGVADGRCQASNGLLGSARMPYSKNARHNPNLNNNPNRNLNLQQEVLLSMRHKSFQRYLVNIVPTTESLLAAWNGACASPTASKVVVPRGTFQLSGAMLQGPCKAPIDFDLEGTLQAPAVGPGYRSANIWVVFAYIDFLTISGTGTFDGQGPSAWGKKCDWNEFCGNLPINIRFNFVTNAIIQDVTSKDSMQFHVNLIGCTNVTFQYFHVLAPETSLNTDGIHIGKSTDIKIINTTIETGDDCISIGDGSKQITVNNVTCGPGHGISIGSLGKYPDEEPVQGVYVRSCTLKNTQNGVRIKTWPDSKPGAASDLHFADITMENVGNPVLIDQEYCPFNSCKDKLPSNVKISNVSFTGIRGSSSTPLAIKLVCSRGIPCENIVVSDIDLKYNGSEGPISSECKNVKPTATGIQNPPACSTTVAPT